MFDAGTTGKRVPRVCGRSRLLAIVWLCAFAFPGRDARAELPGLEPLAAEVRAKIGSRLDGAKVVVCVRSVGKEKPSWAVHEALASEITAALCAERIDAVTASADHRIESMAEPKVPFTATDARRLKVTGREMLLAGSLKSEGRPTLAVSLWKEGAARPDWTEDFSVTASALQQASNVPELNRKVADFCRRNLRQKVDDGICANLATEALKEAGAIRSGIYTWGRELDDDEPILPGDILQLELVKLRSAGFSRGYHHHTAVVEESQPDALVVLQQNVPPAGQVVQRERWPLASFKEGWVVAYRPWKEDSHLPPVSPRRRSEPTIVRKGSSIDLLKTVNPRLDSVKGMWFFEEGTLRPNRDTFARLQLPVAPPGKYTLRLKVKRLVGDDQFGVGLVVGGRQTMMAFDAYHGTVSGLHLVNGKSVKSNPTTRNGRVLPQDQEVSLKISVTPESVRTEADGRTIVDWKGNATDLSLDEKYAMPRSDWLFLGGWNIHFGISEFLLESATGN